MLWGFFRTDWLEELPNIEMFDGTSYDWVGETIYAYRKCMKLQVFLFHDCMLLLIYFLFDISSLYRNYSFPPPTMADDEQSVDDIRNKEKQVGTTQIYLNL